MRIALVVHGFPPYERTGVETHVGQLARELARRGEDVLVFAPRPAVGLPHLALRREARDGFVIDWIALAGAARESPGVAAAFDRWLEHEQPDVVHFHHTSKLGPGSIEVASRRGIVTVFTAHDFHAVCHRTTLLRPDLARCETVGDAELCARCDRAVAVLDAAGVPSDYQIGALGEELTEPQRARLADALSRTASREALDARRERDLRRARAFARLDLVLAPTQHVRRRLVEGGIAPERIELAACGIELEPLAALRAPRSAPQRVRFGFLGGISKHKGVHVLLDAWARVGRGAELAVWGDSTDRAYVEAMRARARELGVAWNGAYEHAELARVLAGVDVVVVPSIWAENAPFVIREAFAARRPVIASRTEALAESVRDGVDGLLFELGDAHALARALERCATEPGLVARLSHAIEPPLDVHTYATGLLARYTELIERRAPRDDVPESLRPFAALHRRLEHTPTRELFERVSAGLERARAALLPETSSAELIAAALARTRAADDLGDARREIEWLRGQGVEAERTRAWLDDTLRGERVARESLEREVGWLREQLADRDARLVAQSGERVALAAELAGARDALAARERELETVTRELAWTRDVLAARDESLAFTAHERDDARTAAEHAAREAVWLRDVLAHAERERVWLRTTLDALHCEREALIRSCDELRELREASNARAESASASLAALEREHTALSRHESWLRGELVALASLLEARTSAEHGLPEPPQVAARLSQARASAVKLLEELQWRRGEMRAAAGDGGALWRSLRTRTALGRRVGEWDARGAP